MMEASFWTAAVALGTSYLSNGVYIYDTFKGKAKPHLLSWLTWCLLMGVAAGIAFTNGAFISGLIIGNGSLMCLVISIISLWRGEKHITRMDYVMFFSALAAIPIWVATQEPLFAAFWVTLIDVLGYGPTFRKAWAKPHEESVRAFCLYWIIWGLNVYSISPYTLTTGLYPTTIFFMNVFLVLMLIYRRRALSVRALL